MSDETWTETHRLHLQTLAEVFNSGGHLIVEAGPFHAENIRAALAEIARLHQWREDIRREAFDEAWAFLVYNVGFDWESVKGVWEDLRDHPPEAQP